MPDLSSLSGPLAMVGRQAETDLMLKGLRKDATSGYVICGPSGLGKTRLAREVANAIGDEGVTILRITGTPPLREVPFGAASPVLPEIDASSVAVALQLGVDALATRSSRGPLVLLVDDAQFLDACTASMLLEVAQQRTCGLVVTLRTPSASPDAVTKLWEDGFVLRIDLSPLEQAEIEAVVSDALDGPVAAATTRWLTESSGGNPLYLRELLWAAAHSGALHAVDGLWVIRRPFPGSARLDDLIGSRLGELSPNAAQVVDLLALGEPLPFGMLVDAAGADAIEEGERLGIVVRRPRADSWAMLGHPLFAEVRRQGLGSARTRALSRLLCDTYPRSSTMSGDELVRIAKWSLDGGGPVDADLTAAAADYARRMFDWDLAVELGSAAVSAGAGAAAALNLAESLYLKTSPDHDRSLEILKAASHAATSSADIASLAAASAHVLGTMMGDRAGAEALLDEALSRVDGTVDRMQLLDARNTFPYFAAEPLETLPDALELIEAADPGMANRAALAAAFAYALLGRVGDAEAVGERGLAIRRSGGMAHRRDHLQSMGRLLAYRGAGRYAEAEVIARAAMDPAAEQIGDVVATFEHLLGMVLIDQGRATAAQKPLRDALVFYRGQADPGPVRWCLGGLVLAHALAGELDAAQVALDELDESGPMWMVQYDLDLIDRGRAWLTAQRGDERAARDMLLAGAEVAAARSSWVTEAYLLHDVARLGGSAEVVTRLGALALTIEGALVETFARHARALAAGDAEALGGVAEAFEEHGALLLAAEVAWDVADLIDDARSAAAWRSRSQALQRRCGTVTTPTLGRGEPVRLSLREQEVARLAASGASTRAIAAELVLSVRTVENHLGRIYEKLGARSREELARLVQGLSE